MSIKPPDHSSGDISLNIIKATTNAIPYFGGTITTLFDLIITSPYEKRVNE